MGKMGAADGGAVYRAVIDGLFPVRTAASCNLKGRYFTVGRYFAHRKHAVLWDSEAKIFRFAVNDLRTSARCNLRIRPRIVFHAGDKPRGDCA